MGSFALYEHFGETPTGDLLPAVASTARFNGGVLKSELIVLSVWAETPENQWIEGKPGTGRKQDC